MKRELQKLFIRTVNDDRTAFWGSVLLSMEIDTNWSRTCAVDGKKLYINEDWLFADDKSIDDRWFVILHEVCHVALLHCDPIRSKGKIKNLWDMATENECNLLLINSGFDAPADAMYDHRFDHMSAEQIYGILDAECEDQEEDQSDDQQSDDQQSDDPQSGDDQGGDDNSDSDDNSEDQSDSDNEESDDGDSDKDGNQPESGKMPTNDVIPTPQDDMDEVKTNVQQAVMQAEKAGNLPAEVKRKIGEAMSPEKDWQELLREYMETAVSDYRDNPTYRRPNMYSQNGFVFAGYIGEELPPMTIVIDTSGSVSDKALSQFEAELQAIREDLSIDKVNVLYVDTEVHNPQVFEKYDELKFDPQGYGGTDFKPAFDYIEEQGIETSLMIYFTDLECSSYPTEPDYPTIWVKWGSCSMWATTPPFGEIVKL